MNSVFGVSLDFQTLVSGNNVGSDAFLQELFDNGVRSIELRPVPSKEDSSIVLATADRIWKRGMRISVHTSVRTAETAVQDIFEPISGVLKAERQENTILVLHPVGATNSFEENLRMMESLSKYAKENALSVKFALENKRTPDTSNGYGMDLVAGVLQETDPRYTGGTFDFGHYAWDTKVWETECPILPPKAFTERVIHTHIHALLGAEEGRDHTTHYPLQIGRLPLSTYIKTLGDSYEGTYNLELEPPRFKDIMSGEEGILGSIQVLKETIKDQRL